MAEKDDMAKKILIVDDDRINAKMLKLTLVKEGYQVAMAFDGDEALTMVPSEKPHLIILDVQMPNMNGYTFMLELQNIEAHKNTPVIVITAHEDVRPIFKFNGVKDYMHKPVKGPELVEKVKKYVS